MGRLDGATLRNVVAQEASLSRVFAPGITMLRVDLRGSRLGAANLDACRLEDSCLATAAMDHASMHGATVTRCDFRGAVLREVELGRAAFIACDFRGAMLDASRGDAGTHRAQFIRCDLRSTSWGGRDLSGTRFEDCKMSGLRGSPRTAEVVITGPDLSVAGDGSARVAMSSPELLWLGAP